MLHATFVDNRALEENPAKYLAKQNIACEKWSWMFMPIPNEAERTLKAVFDLFKMCARKPDSHPLWDVAYKELVRCLRVLPTLPPPREEVVDFILDHVWLQLRAQVPDVYKVFCMAATKPSLLRVALVVQCSMPHEAAAIVDVLDVLVEAPWSLLERARAPRCLEAFRACTRRPPTPGAVAGFGTFVHELQAQVARWSETRVVWVSAVVVSGWRSTGGGGGGGLVRVRVKP